MVRIANVLTELDGIALDAVLFSETRAASQSIQLDGGHMLYTMKGESVASGVGILLHSRHVRRANKFLGISGRVAALDVKVRGKSIRLVATYMPHAGYPQVDFDVAWEQVQQFVEEAAR